MTLQNLSHDQKLALVALLEALALADGGTVSESEEREIGRLAAELGDEAYRRLLDEADRRITNVEQLKAFLATIRDQGAREAIYEAAVEETLADVNPGGNGQKLMDWLAGEWQIPVSITPEEQP